jgi:DNA-binding Lrp family transcriptional regulator
MKGLDKIDEMIINMLEQNSRMSNTDIAQKLNISESAVRRRISKLVNTGTIRKFTIEIDDSNMARAITWISINPAVPTSDVSTRIKNVKGVETVYEIAGQFDIAGVIKGSNIAEINKTVEDIRRIPGVINTNTSMVLRTIR